MTEEYQGPNWHLQRPCWAQVPHGHEGLPHSWSHPGDHREAQKVTPKLAVWPPPEKSRISASTLGLCLLAAPLLPSPWRCLCTVWGCLAPECQDKCPQLSCLVCHPLIIASPASLFLSPTMGNMHRAGQPSYSQEWDVARLERGEGKQVDWHGSWPSAHSLGLFQGVLVLLCVSQPPPLALMTSHSQGC